METAVGTVVAPNTAIQLANVNRLITTIQGGEKMRLLVVLTLIAVLLGASAVMATPAHNSDIQAASALISIYSGFHFDQCLESQTMDQTGNRYELSHAKAIRTLACGWTGKTPI